MREAKINHENLPGSDLTITEVKKENTPKEKIKYKTVTILLTEDEKNQIEELAKNYIPPISMTKLIKAKLYEHQILK